MEAQSGADAMSRVAGAQHGCAPRPAVRLSNRSRDTLSIEAENLDAEVRHFLAEVQAGPRALSALQLVGIIFGDPCKTIEIPRSQKRSSLIGGRP